MIQQSMKLHRNKWFSPFYATIKAKQKLKSVPYRLTFSSLKGRIGPLPPSIGNLDHYLYSSEIQDTEFEKIIVRKWHMVQDRYFQFSFVQR